MKHSQVEAGENNLETTAKPEEAGYSGGGGDAGGENLDDASSTTPQGATPGAPQQSESSARTQPDRCAEGPGESGVEKELPPSERADQGDAAQQQQQQQGGRMESALSWMYLDGINPTQHGPVAESTMLKLLRCGAAHKDMMAWSRGMEEWQPIGQVSVSPFSFFKPRLEAKLILESSHVPDRSAHCCTDHRTDRFRGSASSAQLSTGLTGICRIYRICTSFRSSDLLGLTMLSCARVCLRIVL